MRFIIFLFLIYHSETTTAVLTKLQDAVDLTWPFNKDSIYWPNALPFAFTKKTAEVVNGFWYAANDFCAGEHGGTHFDAPYHFNKLGWKVGEVPLSRLFVRGIMIDLTEEVGRLHDQALLLPKQLEEWESKHGPIPENCVILVRFGWGKYYSNQTLYLGMDDQNNLHFPGISRAAAEWIVESKKVVGVGVDTASVDPGNTTDFPAHQVLSGSLIYNLENVKIPQEFPENGFSLYVMPMLIQEGSGAPLRIVAVPLLTDVNALN